MSNAKAFTRLTARIAPYFAGEKELLERVLFVKTVIRNTLAKFPYEYRPSQLMWAYSPSTAITGFTFQDKNERTAGVPRPVTAEKPVTERHLIKFYVINRRGYDPSAPLTVQEVAFPAALLFKDPIAIAQYARALIRTQQAGDRKAEATRAARRLAELDKKLEEMDRNRQKLEKEKETVVSKREQHLAAAKKHEEQQQARRQEKIARRHDRRERAKN